MDKMDFPCGFCRAVFGGCQKQEVPVSNPEENQYVIYYLNTGITRLEPVEYVTETRDVLDLIQELYQQLCTVPADLDAASPLSSKVELQRLQWDQNVLYMYFDANYTMMSSSQEILCRAALTKTMTQIPGVEYLNIYSGGTAFDGLFRKSGGNAVGLGFYGQY